MNLKESAQKLELEEKELIELIDLFLKTSSSELTELQSAVQKKDFQVAERMAHSLKGAAGTLGFTDIYDEARKLEGAARENRWDDVHEHLGIVRGKLDLTAEAFQREKPHVKG